MRRIVYFLSFVILASQLSAKVHYINKGVKYHIGDNRYALSEDSEFIDAYPSVGQEWIQAFQVSQDDKVRVHIDQIWGVDDCGYCKIIVTIDDRDMLRLTHANNHKPIDTLEPLAAVLSAGKTHYLKIASYGSSKVDDFMIQDVWVETEVADVKMLDPGPILKAPEDPLPVFHEPEATPTPLPPSTPCEKAPPKQGWFPGEGMGRSSFDLASKDRVGAGSGKLLSLSPGEALEFYLMVDAVMPDRDVVGHSLELVMEGASKDAWILSFDSAQASLVHGNLMLGGAYRPDSFNAPYRPGSWTQVRIQSCADGRIRLSFNGREVSRTLASGMKGVGFSMRAMGMRARFSRQAGSSPQFPGLPEPPLPGGGL